jgi:hypothetical protein
MPGQTLEAMIAELRQLREREKQLKAQIREKVKEQRKVLDEAEKEAGEEAQSCYPLPCPMLLR